MDKFQEQLKKIGEYGVVDQVSHPIATIIGIPNARLHEIIIFETGEMGEVFMVQRDSLSVLIFSKYPVKVGTYATRLGKTVTIPVGNEMLGKIVDPFGNPINGKDYKRPAEERETDVAPAGLTQRAKITEPLLTGITVIDMLVPLGKGQKELIIGDRKTGKTAAILAAIKTQVKLGTICIYAAIGKKRSDIKKLESYLTREKIMDKVCVIGATAYDSPSLIFITPYAAMGLAEWFRDQGIDTLVIFDDLTTHARFYREFSLLAKRFPGRDSYPGDIFFTHARLMERCGKFKVANGKEASVTGLPIAEIVEGDFSGYIQTNIMGMTDGHIYFDSDVFYRGRRPAVNIPLSITRVGRQTQTDLLKGVSRELTAFLVTYEKMQSFSHFGAELTADVKTILKKGDLIYYTFDQPPALVIPQEVQLVFFAMIWLEYITEGDAVSLAATRLKVIDAYEKDPNIQKIFKEVISTAKKFPDFMKNVEKYKDLLIKIAGVPQPAPKAQPAAAKPAAAAPANATPPPNNPSAQAAKPAPAA